MYILKNKRKTKQKNPDTSSWALLRTTHAQNFREK